MICDACHDPWPIGSLVLYRRYAICMEDIAAVRRLDRKDAAEGGGYVRGRNPDLDAIFDALGFSDDYTPSAKVVRRHFGLPDEVVRAS